MGLVEKLVEVIRLRNKVARIKAEFGQTKWSYSWSRVLGNELYTKPVLYENPLFNKLFKPVPEERTLKDRIKGSRLVVESIQTLIDALLISINQYYLV